MAELLIVVAIIAVLVAIAIPIFTAQLEKSREATDAANIRAAYAEVVAAEVSGEAGNTTASGSHYSVVVPLKQTKAGWQTEPDLPKNLTSTDNNTLAINTKNDVTVTSTDDGATINIKITGE